MKSTWEHDSNSTNLPMQQGPAYRLSAIIPAKWAAEGHLIFAQIQERSGTASEMHLKVSRKVVAWKAPVGLIC